MFDKDTFQALVASMRGGSGDAPSPGSSDYYHNMYNTYAGTEVAGDESGLLSWWNSKTGRGLTRSELANNAFQAEQAAIQREWQTDMANTEVQRRVTDMKKAGVNPALMYGNASSGASTPSGAMPSSSVGSTGSFADIAGIMMLPLQMQMLKAQIRNTNVRTEGEALKNQYQSLVNGYYPSLTESQIEQIRTGILGTKADINLKEAQTSMQKIQNVLEGAKVQYADDYARLLKEYNEATNDNLRAQKAAALAKAAVDNCEAAYMRANNMRMGSNDYVALAEAICGWLGTSSGEVVQAVVDEVKQKAPKVVKNVKEDLKSPFRGKFGEGTNPKVKQAYHRLKSGLGRVFKR